MRFDRIEYLNAVLEEAPQSLIIDASGRARYESHSNAETPDHAEIGNYETTLARERVEQLSGALDNPPFGSLPDHWGQVLPSDHYRRIRLVTRTETIEKMVGTRQPVNPALRELIRQLDEIANEVARHPRQILRIELAQAGISSTGEMTATLTLSNSGTEPVAYRNPVRMIGADDAHLSLQIWPDKPASELRAEDMFTVDVETATAARPSGGGEADPAVITIPSAASVSFRLQARLPSSRAGTYLTRALYETLTRAIEGNPVMTGEVFSRTVKVNIP